MIYTVTMNPSLDYLLSLPVLQAGETNRSAAERLVAGGKGINVSKMLHNLGTESTILGFAGGFTGEELCRQLTAAGLKQELLFLQNGNTRINVKLSAGQETEVNATGPQAEEAALRAFYRKLEALSAADYVVLSGSLLPGMPRDSYRQIMQHLQGRGVHFIVDATGETLKETLPLHPFLIKPNQRELEEIFKTEITERSQVAGFAKRLQEMGAENVLVSLAGEGAVCVAADGRIFDSRPPEGKVESSVGAGDSMVAGFLHGYLQAEDYKTAFLEGLCAGSASAFSEGFGTKEQVEELLGQIVS
ncbi:1-phosphofructokinase [Kineothrix sp. MSJ-39]|uniref:1-phosphofructokinase n=1 Tax=Kineothrix sp. MSJ-39 TaxID=2841533 RepID=UPI001C108D19|nr:1-phosphofructokinase [Kineothrix sp. MSJ-39]MBU5428872.1 1-phosphofructokinase [Kineothrix sp. MSJ-39]